MLNEKVTSNLQWLILILISVSYKVYFIALLFFTGCMLTEILSSFTNSISTSLSKGFSINYIYVSFLPDLLGLAGLLQENAPDENVLLF